MLWMLCLPNASLFLLLLLCFPAQHGAGNEWSTDIITAWEGDSISITCPMNDSQNQVGMHLRALRQNVNVIYYPKEKPPTIHPIFANRIKYSKEGENLRITLHRLQESDSKIYQCSEIVKINDQPKELRGKTTMVVIKANSSRALEQSPLFANPKQGQSVNITCVLKSSPQHEEFYLLRTLSQPSKVLSVSNVNVSRVSPAFGNRLEYSMEENRIVITLHNLQEEDNGNYICVQVMESSQLSASGTMVLVREVEQACEKSSWHSYVLAVVVALQFCALVCCALCRVDIHCRKCQEIVSDRSFCSIKITENKVKKCFQKKKIDVVYEDMSCNSRRSTLVRSNTNSRAE